MFNDSTETILKNLSELNRREHVISEQRRILIADFARTLFESRDGVRPEEIYSLLLREAGERCLTEDKIELCKNICRLMNITELGSVSPFADLDNAVAAGSHEKIAIVRNDYNNRAFERFSGVIPRAKAVYSPDFESCCETVSEGKCEFTVIPIEDNADGKMFGFYSLIDRFELSIQAVCSVESENKTVRYALAGRSFQYRELEKAARAKKKFFEFSLTYDTENATPDIFTAASLCDAELHKTASISLSYNDMRTRFYFSFEITRGADIIAFLMYLWLEYPGYSPIGIYGEI